MPEVFDVLPEPPAVLSVGGSKVSKERVSGPPSKMYPLLRDLGAASKKATIMIEIDRENKREIGILSGASGDSLHYRVQTSPGHFNRTIKLAGILAFRVLSIEVDSIPADL